MPKYKKVDPRILVSVPTILCPECQMPMKIVGKVEVEGTKRGLRGKTSRKVPHLRYRCTKCKNEFDLNLERRGGGCFIATAAYGTSAANEINLLRSFRDSVLRRGSSGRRFISLYYRFSPPLARVMERSEILKSITRYLLYPIIRFMKRTVKL